MIRSTQAWLNADIRALAEGFLGWWLGELRGLVPAWVAAGFSAGRRRVTVDLGPVVVIRQGDGPEALIRAQIPATDRAGLEAVLVGVGSPEDGITLRLPPEKVLLRRLDLPLTRDRDLVPLLRFELERQTPFASREVHYGTRVIARDGAARRMIVEVAMARRSVVEAALAEARSWGRPIAEVAASPQSAGGWSPALLRSTNRPSDQRRQRLVLAGLAALALALLAALIVADDLRASAMALSLQTQLHEAQAAAKEAGALQTKAEGLTAQRRFLPELRRDRSLASLFEELAKILPDDTWLSGVTIDADTIRIQGYSSKADRLIALVDGSTLFGDARFTAPLTKMANAEADRFDLTFKRRPRVGQ